MWKLRLNSIRAFAAVYRYGGIRAAARRLEISHSSVSRHLAELEAWLGVTLIRGSGGRRKLTFTRQGTALGEAATRGLREIDLAVSALREARSDSSVMIGAPSSFAVRWLLPRLPKFEKLNPDVEISVVVDRRIDGLEQGDIDVAIWMGEKRESDGLRWEPLMDDELYPVMGPALWEEKGRPTNPEDLVGLRLLHDRDPHASWAIWQREHGPATIDVRKGPRFTSTDVVLRAAVQGQGVALARHRLAADDVSAGYLVRAIPELRVKMGIAYWMVLSTRMAAREETLAVVKWLRAEAHQTDAT